MPGRQALRDDRGTLRLDADDHDICSLLLDRGGNPGDQPAAANRNKDRAELRQGVDDFEADRPLAGDDGRIVKWMDQHEVATLLFGFQAFLPFGNWHEDDLGPEVGDRPQL